MLQSSITLSMNVQEGRVISDEESKILRLAQEKN
jgi:hypothetical protein